MWPTHASELEIDDTLKSDLRMIVGIIGFAFTKDTDFPGRNVLISAPVTHGLNIPL